MNEYTYADKDLVDVTDPNEPSEEAYLLHIGKTNRMGTNKVWDNELASKTNFREGHDWTQIMNNVKEGDKVINGIGEVFICTDHTDEVLIEGKVFNNGFNWSVHLHPTKKDGTIHKGMNFISYVNYGTGWDRVGRNY